MGSYCNFCGYRCFVPTKQGDYVARDLKATCNKGIKFDLEKYLEEKRLTQITWRVKMNQEKQQRN
jgi:hypothetical protein